MLPSQCHGWQLSPRSRQGEGTLASEGNHLPDMLIPLPHQLPCPTHQQAVSHFSGPFHFLC